MVSFNSNLNWKQYVSHNHIETRNSYSFSVYSKREYVLELVLNLA